MQLVMEIRIKKFTMLRANHKRQHSTVVLRFCLLFGFVLAKDNNPFVLRKHYPLNGIFPEPTGSTFFRISNAQ